MIPVNVIIPAARAPKICCTAETESCRRSPSPTRSSRSGSVSASVIATTFVASTGTHMAEASQMRARKKRRPLTARPPGAGPGW